MVDKPKISGHACSALPSRPQSPAPLAPIPLHNSRTKVLRAILMQAMPINFLATFSFLPFPIPAHTPSRMRTTHQAYRPTRSGVPPYVRKPSFQSNTYVIAFFFHLPQSVTRTSHSSSPILQAVERGGRLPPFLRHRGWWTAAPDHSLSQF